jgi:hypothetical protein
MFVIIVSVVSVVSVVSFIVYKTIAAKNADISYYKQQTHKYITQLDAELASKVNQLKDKDAVISCLENELYKYNKLFPVSVY